MSNIPSRGPLEDAFERYSSLKQEYTLLVAEHPEVFSAFFQLIEDTNAANEEIRSGLRNASYDTIGEFKRKLQRRTKIDADILLELMPEAKDLDGLFKYEINKPVFDGYVSDGTIPRAVAAEATIELDPMVKIYGPKAVKGDL